jgi:hypothetical protein
MESRDYAVARHFGDRAIVGGDSRLKLLVRVATFGAHALALPGVEVVGVIRRIELDETYAFGHQPFDFITHNRHQVREQGRGRRIESVGDTALIARDDEIRRRRQRNLERPLGGALQEGQFVGGQFARLAKPSSHRVRGARFRATARALPFEHHLVAHEPFHSLRHVRQPRAAAHFAVGYDFHSDFALPGERLVDGAILHCAQFPFGKPAGGVGLTCLQQLRRTQQAADLFGSIRWLHKRQFYN